MELCICKNSYRHISIGFLFIRFGEEMTEDKKPDEIIAVPEKDRKTFQRGVQLFVVYMAFYILFTIAGTVRKEILMIRVWGMNLGIVGGMSIIAGAILIAVYYNWYAGQMEAEA